VRAVAQNIDHRTRKLIDPPMRRPGGITARHAVTVVRSFVEQRRRKDVARQCFQNDVGLNHLLERAAAPPASTTQPGWALERVHKTISDILDNLLPASVLAQLRARRVRNHATRGHRLEPARGVMQQPRVSARACSR
jgi:hypothetical protein